MCLQQIKAEGEVDEVFSEVVKIFDAEFKTGMCCVVV